MPIGLTAATAVVADHLRPPSPLDLLAHAYEDWFHLNAFVPSLGVSVLVNVSLHGDVVAPTSLAVGTVAVHRTGDPPRARVEVVDQRDASVTSRSIGVAGVARIALGAGGRDLAVSAVTDGVELVAHGTAVDAPIVAETPAPFGRGWIAWRAIPRMWLDGTLTLDEDRIDLAACEAIGYHDHNWGRWCWGDDAGWSWGTFPGTAGSAPGGGPPVTVTVAHRTDRHHRSGRPIARVQTGGTVRDYPAGTVDIVRHGRRRDPLLRLPGATAALRSDRRDPDLPERVVVVIDDGIDHLEVDLAVEDALQLINAHPASVGHTFVHELFGRFTCRGTIGRRHVGGTGSGVFEHVD